MKRERLHFSHRGDEPGLEGLAQRVLCLARARPSRRRQEDERLEVAIKAAHPRSRETHGVRRPQPEPAAESFPAGRDRIDRPRKALGLRRRQKRKFKATTNSSPSLAVADNLLNQTFTPTAPHPMWLTDITSSPTWEGWLYPAGVKDVFTCELEGYAMAERMTQERVSQARFRAVARKRPQAGLIHPAGRGSQYCSAAYPKLLVQFGMQPSMSRKGNCYDNAPLESFWGSLKNEWVHHHRFASRDQAIASIRQSRSCTTANGVMHALAIRPPAVFA